MRRSLVSSAFIGLLAVLLAPGVTVGSTTTAIDDAGTIRPVPVAVQSVTLAAKGLRDEVAMVLIGSILIGLGTAVRRAA